MWSWCEACEVLTLKCLLFVFKILDDFTFRFQIQRTMNEMFQKQISNAQNDYQKANCEQCGMTFASITVMRRHVLAVHQKVKNFSCDSCSKTFSKNSNLNIRKAFMKNVEIRNVVHVKNPFLPKLAYEIIKLQSTKDWKTTNAIYAANHLALKIVLLNISNQFMNKNVTSYVIFVKRNMQTIKTWSITYLWYTIRRRKNSHVSFVVVDLPQIEV